jgi:alkylation response protein AidB-like acyl-CoA dehydrogenase
MMTEKIASNITNPLELAELMAEKIAPYAAHYDEKNQFALESIRLLQANGYAALTAPKEYGGLGAELYDLVRAQERLAMGDAAVALSMGMSLQFVLDEKFYRKWSPKIYHKVMSAVAERGALINSIATEPNVGSPSRGGKPETIAVPSPQGGWRISGHKTFASLAPVLDFMIVSATIKDGTDDVARFMLEDREGIHVKETWNSMSMRATGSHDMIFENAYAPPDSLLKRIAASSKPAKKSSTIRYQPPCFSLSTVAVYLGVAADAHQAAVRYAAKRVPPVLGYPLTKVDSIRDKLAESERELRAARMMLYDCARRIDANRGRMDDELQLDIYVTKHTAANNAISVVDRAMRIAGGSALAKGGRLERAYRNVRPGLIQPPPDDVTSRVLAQWTINANVE